MFMSAKYIGKLWARKVFFNVGTLLQEYNHGHGLFNAMLGIAIRKVIITPWSYICGANLKQASARQRLRLAALTCSRVRISALCCDVIL
jgi:hypothetical protein